MIICLEETNDKEQKLQKTETADPDEVTFVYIPRMQSGRVYVYCKEMIV